MKEKRYCAPVCGNKEDRSSVAGPPSMQEMLDDSALCAQPYHWRWQLGCHPRLAAAQVAVWSGHLPRAGDRGSLRCSSIAMIQFSYILFVCSLLLCSQPLRSLSAIQIPGKQPQLTQYIATVTVLTELSGQDTLEVTGQVFTSDLISWDQAYGRLHGTIMITSAEETISGCSHGGHDPGWQLSGLVYLMGQTYHLTLPKQTSNSCWSSLPCP